MYKNDHSSFFSANCPPLCRQVPSHGIHLVPGVTAVVVVAKHLSSTIDWELLSLPAYFFYNTLLWIQQSWQHCKLIGEPLWSEADSPQRQLSELWSPNRSNTKTFLLHWHFWLETLEWHLFLFTACVVSLTMSPGSWLSVMFVRTGFMAGEVAFCKL